MKLNEKEFEKEIQHEDSQDNLSLKERQIFEVLKDHKGILTIRKIQSILGFSSPSVVKRYLDKLEKKNYIEKIRGYKILSK